MIGNLMAHQVERNPLSRASEFVFVNNVVYDRGTMALDLQAEGGRSTKNSVVGNVFIDRPEPQCATRGRSTSAPAAICKLGSSSRVYVCGQHLARPWATCSNNLMVLTGGNTISGLISTTTAPVWNSGSDRAQDRGQRGL